MAKHILITVQIALFVERRYRVTSPLLDNALIITNYNADMAGGPTTVQTVHTYTTTLNYLRLKKRITPQNTYIVE